jgi:hypothetical protein
MRSVNALETQKRDNVADTAEGIGLGLYNHLVAFRHPSSYRIAIPLCTMQNELDSQVIENTK